MDEPFNCTCLLKTDLENSVDLFSFLDENYPIPGILNNLNKLSYDDQRCACCLLGTALTILARKKKNKLGWTMVKTL